MAIYKLVRRFEDGHEEPLPFDQIGFFKVGTGLTIDDETWIVDEIIDVPATLIATKQQ